MEKLAVCASGEGTLLEAILKAEVPVSLVVVDRICRAVDIAKKYKVQVEIVDRSAFKSENGFDRDRYTECFESKLQDNGINLVALAGFMTVLGPEIFKNYKGKILNSHPSLLPKYPGKHAVRDVLKSEDVLTGFTIHEATKKLDDGPIVTQGKVPIFPDDTEASLHERIKTKEREVYPQILKEKLGLK